MNNHPRPVLATASLRPLPLRERGSASVLTFLLTFFFTARGLLAEPLTFQTSDGIEIVGEWTKPKAPYKFTVILLHGLGSSKEEWTGFSQALSSKGFGVLAYDARGHGQSKKKAGGAAADYQHFYGRGLNSEWGKMVEDLGLAAETLIKKHKINPAMVAVGGASIGANIALRYAVKKKEVPFAILLSPGIDYQGVTTNDVISNYGNRPLLLAASPGDGYAFQSVLALKKMAPGGSNVSIFQEDPRAGHGGQTFKRAKHEKPSALEEKIIQWVEQQKI